MSTVNPPGDIYTCDCLRYCKSTREVSRSTWFNHRAYRTQLNQLAGPSNTLTSLQLSHPGGSNIANAKRRSTPNDDSESESDNGQPTKRARQDDHACLEVEVQMGGLIQGALLPCGMLRGNHRD
ncbi:hypothetical protein JAAARDRAFT_291978 [Jaapia argillacea MUCL 33604]|uniref:Uncharacterized protein n=1 Tax=Jaapia argillacea MUCL 33604 TaxID=933084 RepID=A0A067Q1C9_9AGAM|nr:hypothetical protein JAAARDRAFT_291978 [Jaapia argillacea MUCL 33604]